MAILRRSSFRCAVSFSSGEGCVIKTIAISKQFQHVQGPDCVETNEGVTEFVVLQSQVILAEATIAEMEQKAIACEKRAKSEPNQAESLRREAPNYRDCIAGLAYGHWPTPKALR
jgi:hypothetical protein